MKIVASFVITYTGGPEKLVYSKIFPFPILIKQNISYHSEYTGVYERRKEVMKYAEAHF